MEAGELPEAIAPDVELSTKRVEDIYKSIIRAQERNPGVEFKLVNYGSDAPMPGRCGHKNKTTGRYCMGHPMHGKQLCRVHHGKSQGHPVVNAIYSKHQTGTLVKRIEDMQNDPSVMNAKASLAVVVALLESYILALGRSEEIANEDGIEFIPELKTIAEISKIVNQVSQVIERVEKKEASHGISPEQLREYQRILGERIKVFCSECPKFDRLATSLSEAPVPN